MTSIGTGRWRAVPTVIVVSLVALLAPAGSAADLGEHAGAGRSLSAIDTGSRSSVRAAYLNVLRPALATPVGWTGDVATCTAGAPSAAARTASLTAVNYFREMAGLPAVTFDAALDAKAQEAALMMKAQGALSHEPDPLWACHTDDGAEAAGKSNLALGGGAAGAGAAALYMRDPGSSNVDVGHRRWILYPRQTTLGNGFTDSSDALWVLGPFGTRAAAPPCIAWPSAGYFPGQLEPNGRWSVSYNDGSADFSDATVRITRDGADLPVTRHQPRAGYGDPTLVFEVGSQFTAGQSDRTYDVTVDNIRRGASTSSCRYQVTIFDAVGPPDAPADVTGAAGNGSVAVSWSTPDSDGGSTISSYQVTASPGGRTCTWTSGPLSCTVTGLTNGTPYTFTVRATNARGTGPASAASSPVTPRTVPGAPSGVSGAAGSASVGVSWTAPASNGGAPITSYTATASPGGHTCTWTSGPLSCTVTGLTNGTPYTFTVRATNVAGNGAPSSPSPPVTPRTVPGAPSAVAGLARDRSVAVSWAAPASNGGAPITSYTATASPGGHTCTWTSGPLSCTVTGLTNGTPYTFTVRATNVAGDGAPSSPSPPVTPDSSRFTSMSPVRLLDSRPASKVGSFATPWSAGTTRSVVVAGTNGIPATAEAVVLNVTATGTTATSFLTLWPTGTPRPTASSLNWTPGWTIPNAVTVKVGTGGAIDVFNNLGTVDVIIDVVGYFEPSTGAGYTPMSPARLLDSRPASKVGDHATPWSARTTRSVVVAGTNGIPATAEAVVLNVTATGTTATSFLTLWPTGTPRPTASSLNWTPGWTIPNAVTVKVGTGGAIDVFNNLGTVDVIIDVVGYYTPGGGADFHPSSPARILDSRPASKVGDYATPWSARTTRSVVVTDAGGAPAGALAVLTNTTVTGTDATSFLTMWPSETTRPTASSLNWAPGWTIPNAVTVKVGTGGAIDVFNNLGTVDVIIDLAGWYG